MQERAGSRWPAVTASLNIEPPTGSAKAQLGSGLIDYYLNGILQKTISPRNVLRFNGGAAFAGNTVTSAVGIRARGTAFTGGTSLRHQFTSKLNLGVEVYGGYSLDEIAISHALQEELGGNYGLGSKLGLNFGFIVGQQAGSPHYGFQLGFSKDF